MIAKAPGTSASASPVFADNEKNHNLANASSVKKTGKIGVTKGLGNQNLSQAPSKSGGKAGSKFIQDLGIHGLAKAPESTIKSASKFINDLNDHNLTLTEGQKNKSIEKAPSLKGAKDTKKHIENEKNANLAGAHGNSKKNGKKFTEDLKRANLSSAPGKKNSK